MNLFVYGTLKDKELFERITGHDASYKPAILYGYLQISHMIIQKAEKSDFVSGILIENISNSDLEYLDHYEALNKLYLRKKVEVITNDNKMVVSWVYIPIDSKVFD